MFIDYPIKIYFVIGTLFAKISGILMSLLEFGKMSSRRKCKISAVNDPRISPKTQNARKLRKLRNDASVVDQQNDYDPQKALSLKELSHSVELEENDAVPDAVEYQVPFGSDVGEAPMNDTTNDLEKQFVCLRQELQDEIRREIKSLGEELRTDLDMNRKKSTTE